MEKDKLQDDEVSPSADKRVEIPLVEADVSLRYDDVYQDFSLMRSV